MNEINIGINISAKRKEKGITQEELADFLGVTKASVSKWECNQSYPDVTLLPIIATYFDISVDELIGYHPQLSKNKIKEIYLRLSSDFAQKPFSEVYDECIDYGKKYYSCWKLQFYIGLSLVNHGKLAGEKCEEVYKKAEYIFDRIIKNSEDVSLSRMSTYLKATCLVMRNDVDRAINNLEGLIELPLCPDVLLANAYEMKGNGSKAISILQEYIYVSVSGILGAMPSLIRLYGNDKEKAIIWSEKALEVGKIFKVNEINPSIFLSIYCISAYICLIHGEKDKALDMIESYVKIVRNPNFFPIKLRKNVLFDSIDGIFEKLELGDEAPRSDEVIKKDIKEIIINNPIFKPLEGEERFKDLVKRLKEV